MTSRTRKRAEEKFAYRFVSNIRGKTVGVAPLVHQTDNCSIALKLIPKASFAERVKEGQERPDSVVREILAQILICKVARDFGLRDHEMHVVKILGAMETASMVAIELELMHSQNLMDYHENVKKKRWEEDEVRVIVRQLLAGISLCQRSGVAHRDVKMSNICITKQSYEAVRRKEKGAHLVVKLADFGMAGFPCEDGLLRGRCGTVGYVAPEIMATDAGGGYGNNVDIYSVSLRRNKCLFTLKQIVIAQST